MANDIHRINCKLIPIKLNTKNGYSPKQKQQIIEMMKAYTNVVAYAGYVKGVGSEIDAPEYGALETLLEVKKQADLLPPQFRDFNPEAFEIIEDAIKYCRKR
jgi:hypothetical protein